MKLNYKRTIQTSLVFFTICMMYQLMDTYLPVFLNDMIVREFGGTASDHAYIVGFILGVGNIFSLASIPLISVLSDRTKSSYGRRTPYIIWGTFTQIIMFPMLPILFMANELGWFIAIMILSVIIINTYRVPTVALMPDITPKPLRNRANSIVNFIGYSGMILAGILAIIFPISNGADGFLEYNVATLWIPFGISVILMVTSVMVTVVKINENKLALAMKKEMEVGERIAETDAKLYKNQGLTKVDKRNLILILVSLLLWNMSFIAVQNYGSLFGLEVLGVDTGWWGGAVIIMTVVGMLSFIPLGKLADKFGRKKIMIVGLSMMLVGLFVACFVRTPWVFYLIIACAGVGWAIIGVVSYPMIIEMATKDNVGKFTSFYYIFKGLALALTPMLASLCFVALGYNVLFVYATIFMALALFCFCFYKTPKHKKEEKKSEEPDIEERLWADDSNSKFIED